MTVDPNRLLPWVTLIIAIVTAVVASTRWLRKQLQEEVRRSTAQIQPGANGGSSLPDVIKAVHELATDNREQHKRLHGRVDSLQTDVQNLQLWAQGRPCLLDRHERAERAARLLAEREVQQGAVDHGHDA